MPLMREISRNRFLTVGFQFMLMSTLSFAVANLFIKFMPKIPAMEVVFFRCALGTVFCVVGLRNSGADWRGSHRWSLFLRGLFGTSALFMFFSTLQHMPMASAITIAYLSPIFTAVLAMFILRERVVWQQWIFFALAFIGVAVIERYDPNADSTYVLTGIAAAFCSGVAYNLVRSMKGSEHPLVVVLHFQLFGAVAGLVALPFVWKTPNGIEWIYLALVAVFSQIGQILLTKALQRENASKVSMAGYSGVLYGLIFGIVFLDEEPATFALIGIALVVGGMVASLYFNARSGRASEVHVTEV